MDEKKHRNECPKMQQAIVLHLLFLTKALSFNVS